MANRSTNAYIQRNLTRNQELRIRQFFGNEIKTLGVFAINDIMHQLVAAAEKSTQNFIQGYVQVTSSAVQRNREGRIKTIHREAAEDALVSVRDAFMRRPRPHSPQYRVGESRISGGRLLSAITSPEMYRVGRDGLDFINPNFLDREAAHWYRMNFGVGANAAGTKPGRAAKITIFGVTSATDLALTSFGPSRSPMTMPPGYFEGAGPRSPFYPKPFRRSNIPTLGITGSRFLDAGVNRLARTIPQQYEKLFTEWFTEFNKKGSGPFASQVVTVNKSNLKQAAAILKRNRSAALGLRSLR